MGMGPIFAAATLLAIQLVAPIAAPFAAPVAARLVAPLVAPLAAQTPHRAPAASVPPAIAAIRQQDLERDLYTMAGDSMRGREAGTLDELRASVWLGEQMRKIGLVPKGDGGS